MTENTELFGVFSRLNKRMTEINAFLLENVRFIENIFDLILLCNHYYLKVNDYHLIKDEQIKWCEENSLESVILLKRKQGDSISNVLY